MQVKHQMFLFDRAELAKRFWPKVQKAEGDACWFWIPSPKAVYGNFYLGLASSKRAVVNASRAAYYIATGQDPGGLFVCHRCDTPRCVRPDHLFLGSARDNIHDCLAKGRYTAYRSKARVSPSDILDMRKRRAANPSDGRLIPLFAKQYGLSKCTITQILNGTSWREVGGPIVKQHIEYVIEHLEPAPYLRERFEVQEACL